MVENLLEFFKDKNIDVNSVNDKGRITSINKNVILTGFMFNSRISLNCLFENMFLLLQAHVRYLKLKRDVIALYVES